MNEPRTIAVTHPGGLAKQYRIQYRSDEKSPWRQSTVSRSCKEAEQALTELRSRGLHARMVHYRMPSAA